MPIRSIPRRGLAFRFQRLALRCGFGGVLLAVRNALAPLPQGNPSARVAVVANPSSQGWLVEVQDRRFTGERDRRCGMRRTYMRWDRLNPLRRHDGERRFSMRSVWKHYYLNIYRSRDVS